MFHYKWMEKWDYSNKTKKNSFIKNKLKHSAFLSRLAEMGGTLYSLRGHRLCSSLDRMDMSAAASQDGGLLSACQSTHQTCPCCNANVARATLKNLP